MSVVSIFSTMARRYSTSSTPHLRIICCITKDRETSGTCDDFSCLGDRDYNSCADDGDDNGTLENDEDLGGIASVTEETGPVWMVAAVVTGFLQFVLVLTLL